MILSGDIGGTKTLLGLFERGGPRPSPLLVRPYVTLDFPDLPSMIEDFLGHAAPTSLEAACFGVAGPVIGEHAQLTNVPWVVDARRVADRFGIARVALLNDLAAMAYSVPLLYDTEVHALQKGRAAAGGNIVLIAAGTGLGEALLHYVDGRFVPVPSEGGHADYAPRNEREFALTRDLTARFGRASVEHVVSGRGLVNIHRSLKADIGCDHFSLDDVEAPARITTAALSGSHACCKETLDLFVEAYGAESGNLALRAVATGGVYIGGGIAPKLLPALATGAFLNAFRSKSPLEALLDEVPVNVILNAESGLVGSAAHAATLTPGR
jgi:glucokinase